MQIFINYMFFKGNIMQFWTSKFAMIKFTVLTLDDFEITLKVFRFISKLTKMLKIKLSYFKILDSLLSIQKIEN
jgi:hypothetical protein